MVFETPRTESVISVQGDLYSLISNIAFHKDVRQSNYLFFHGDYLFE